MVERVEICTGKENTNWIWDWRTSENSCSESLLHSQSNPSTGEMEDDQRRILERERYQIEQIRQLDLEELQVEEVDDLYYSSDDNPRHPHNPTYITSFSLSIRFSFI